ncbi:MAG: response regulator [Hydrococcus sp. Prado102]|nr:response regulator [Hydrococcus sp. Prado102]
MPRPVIMCIDDESIVLTSLNLQLKQEFRDIYSLEMAESTNEALEIIEELKEDNIELLVVVCDWLMPGKTGDEFLIELHQSYPETIKILLTGQADRSAIERAKKYANLYACVPKPWTRQELISTIKSAISQSQN